MLIIFLLTETTPALYLARYFFRLVEWLLVGGLEGLVSDE